MSAITSLISLFLVAFAAATIFPAQSEALLAALILKTDIAVWLLVAVASAGNILGSCVNWVLGVYVETFKNRRWFPVKEKSLERVQAFYKKYGRWSLLLSWVPFIGDPLTVMAGFMKEHFAVFLLFVSVAKIGRYVALAWLLLKAAPVSS